jgi:predicted PurR-regulated permease PerM
LLGLALVVISFFVLAPFLKAIILGGLLAYISYPIYRFIHKKIKSKNLSSFLVCLIILLILVIPSIFIIKVLIDQAYLAFNVVKSQLTTGLFTNCQSSICNSIHNLIQEPLVNEQIQSITGTISSSIIEKGSKLLLSIPNFILNLFVMFFTLFYFLKDGECLIHKIRDYLSLQKKEYAHLLDRLRDIVHGVVFGYILVSLIQGAIGALGFYLFGVSSPLFWGLVMALLALIVIGTGIIWGPVSIYFILNGIFNDSYSLILKGIGLFLYGLVLISSIDNVLKPKIIGNTAKINSAIVMVGIFGGLLLFGPLGVFIGPLVLSLTYVIIDTYLSKNKSKDAFCKKNC